MFYAGKTSKGRYVTSAGGDDTPPIIRYYPQRLLVDFNAAILAELGLAADTPMSEVFRACTPVDGGWRKDEAFDSEQPRSNPKKGKGGQRKVPNAAIERIDALRGRLLRIGDTECRLAIEELRHWSD